MNSEFKVLEKDERSYLVAEPFGCYKWIFTQAWWG